MYRTSNDRSGEAQLVRGLGLRQTGMDKKNMFS